MSSVFLMIIILLPILGGIFLNLFKNLKMNIVKIISLSIVILTSILTWLFIFISTDKEFTMFKIVEMFTFSLRLDGIGKIFAGMVSLLWPFALVYSWGYMKHDGRKKSYNAFYVMTLGAVLGLACASNLFTMFVFYEMITFITLPLIVHSGTSEARKAGRVYINYSLTGSSLSLVGLIMMSSVLGTNTFMNSETILQIVPTLSNPILYHVGFVLCFFGFGVKSAIFPLHHWLPLAGAAPTPTTALLHAVAVVKAGIFALLRITYYLGGSAYLQNTWIQYLIICLASFTVVYGSCKALKQQHLKRRFAYSTISNLSYIIIAIGLMSSLGLIAAVVHLIVHSITKICLFFVCGEVIENSEAKYVYQLDGFAKKMPITFVCYTIASLSLTGIPLFAGFVSKWYLISASVETFSWASVIGIFALIISALLTAIYTLSISFKAFVNNQTEINKEVYEKAHEKEKEMLLPICVFALCCVVFGISSGWFISLISIIL